MSTMMLVQVAYAQDFVGDLKKLSKQFTNAGSLSMQTEYLIFSTHHDNIAQEHIKGIYLRQGKAQYKKLGNIASFQDEELSLAVNYQNKELLVGNAQPTFPFLRGLSSFESFNEKYGQVVFEETDKAKIYTVRLTDQASLQFEKVVFKINKKTGFFQHIQFYYKTPVKADPSDPDCKAEKPREEIVFKNVVLDENIRDKRLKSSFYITKKSDTFQAQPRFRDFKLINQFIALKH